MTEYIDREVLLAEIANMTIVSDDLYDYGIMAGVDAVKKKVAEAPAADVVERSSFEAVGQKYAQIQDKLIRGELASVVHASWEEHPQDTFATMHHCKKIRCTHCWHFLYYNYGDSKLYCPNCGADMRGE